MVLSTKSRVTGELHAALSVEQSLLHLKLDPQLSGVSIEDLGSGHQRLSREQEMLWYLAAKKKIIIIESINMFDIRLILKNIIL